MLLPAAFYSQRRLIYSINQTNNSLKSNDSRGIVWVRSDVLRVVCSFNVRTVFVKNRISAEFVHYSTVLLCSIINELHLYRYFRHR